MQDTYFPYSYFSQLRSRHPGTYAANASPKSRKAYRKMIRRYCQQDSAEKTLRAKEGGSL